MVFIATSSQSSYDKNCSACQVFRAGAKDSLLAERLLAYQFV